jgi:hypothetical protein
LTQPLLWIHYLSELQTTCWATSVNACAGQLFQLWSTKGELWRRCEDCETHYPSQSFLTNIPYSRCLSMTIVTAQHFMASCMFYASQANDAVCWPKPDFNGQMCINVRRGWLPSPRTSRRKHTYDNNTFHIGDFNIFLRNNFLQVRDYIKSQG